MEENSIVLYSVPQLVSVKRCTEVKFNEWINMASDHIGILYVSEGFLNIQNEQKTTILLPNSVYISLCGKKVRVYADSCHTHIKIEILADYLIDRTPGLVLPDTFYCGGRESYVGKIIQQIYCQSNASPADPFLTALLYQLLSTISCVYLDGKTNGSQEGSIYIYRAKKFILEDLSKNLSVNDIAAYLSISPGYLSHLFSEKLGITVKQYINTLKINRVEELVLNCGFTIREAGKQVGIQESSYLSKLFRKLRGVNLSELKKQFCCGELPVHGRFVQNACGSVFSDKNDSLLPARLWINPVKDFPSCRFSNRNRLFQGIPTVEISKKGRLFFAMYGGMRKEESGNFVMFFIGDAHSYDFGEPYLVLEAPSPECRTFDPCLWMDPSGRLWLFYAQSYTYIDGRLGVWACVCNDPDEENPKFTAPRRIANGVMVNKPTVLSSGEWLLSCAIWCDELSDFNDIPEERFSNVYCSADNGASFCLIGHSDYPDRSTDEHMIVELKDGRLWMLIRGRCGIGQAFSRDKGQTWTDVGYSGIPNPCSRFHIRRLRSGRLLLINHKDFECPDPDNVLPGYGRNHLNAMLSDDDGKTWSHGIELDPRNEVSYPDMTEGEDKRLYIVYDRSRYDAREILMACITEEDILAGHLVKDGSFLQRIINKGGA